MRDSAKHGSASSGGWLSPLILPLCYFWRWKSEEGASGWDDAEETRKQREQVDVFSPISFTTQTLIRRMWPFPVKRIIKIFWLIGSEKGEAGRNAVVFCKVIDKSHSWFFFLFDVDHFQSLYWICYSIASVFCFACGILAALSEIEPTPTPLEGEVLTTGGGFSVPKSCPTLCDPTDWNMPGMPVLYYLLEVAQTHMSIESTMPSSLPLSLPALNLSQHQDLYQWVGSSHQDCHCITREVPTFVIFDLTCPWPSSFLRAPFLLQQRERERDTSNSPAGQASHSWEFPTRRKVKVKSLSRVWLFATPWTVAHHASPSMGFSRQEYWIGLPFPSPEDLPDPGIEPGSPVL